MMWTVLKEYSSQYSEGALNHQVETNWALEQQKKNYSSQNILVSLLVG